MSGLYNMMFGVNKAAPVLLAMLGIDANQVPRFQDCFLLNGKIVIHTRTGGGNREGYEDGNMFLTTLPGYEGDSDDDFDSTYANFYYAVPERFKPLMDKIPEGENPAKRWQNLLEKLRTGTPNDPVVKKVTTTMAPIIDGVNHALNTKEKS